MNKITIIYIILISMIFISLGVGMFIFNNNNISKEGLDQLNKQNIGDLLKDRNGSQVKYKDRASIVIPQVSMVDNKGIVSRVIPNIALDANGFALYNNEDNTYLNDNKQNKGDLLKDAYDAVVRDRYSNNTFIIDSVKYNGLVESVTPKLKLTTSGYAELDRAGNLIYLDNNNNYITSNNDVKYNSNPDNFPQYHASEEQIKEDSDYTEFKNGDIYVRDQTGNVVILPGSSVQGSTLYFQPGYFQFGSSTYVPNYEDSVYLSKTTGLSTISNIINPPYVLGGICNQYKDQPLLLEEACQKLNGNVCASTSCCVLLGGSKCVSGNEGGPSLKSNYSDIFVPNRDFYYFQGKCYGNCQ